MLYQIYEAQRSLMEPFADFAQAPPSFTATPLSPFGQNPFAQRVSAGYDLLYRLGKDYEKPPSTSRPSTSTASTSRSTNASRSTSPSANCAASSASPTTPPR
jgi:poly-beta-hydroxyalkanoate depolymerase